MEKIFIKLALVSTLCVVAFSGCKKMFEKSSTKELNSENAYQNIYDADAAVMGIYGKFMGLADRYIILNELRADLLDYTSNANAELRQISNHTATEDNTYASPRPFYEVIINCNDVLQHLTAMYEDKKITETDYYQRYSDVGCLRSFLYLQLGIHYGDQVRYVTSPLATLDEVNNADLFPQVTFDALLDSLVTFAEALPYKDRYPSGTSLNITLDGYPTQLFYINKLNLLGDLYLWQENYNMAATYYRQLMEYASDGSGSSASYTQYKLGWTSTDAVDNYVEYTLAGSALNLRKDIGWRCIFDRLPTTTGYTFEWIWALPYDNNFAPANPLIDLFSPIGGSYLVKPSQQIMDMWNSQTQRVVTVASSTNGLPYDARGELSVQTIGGQPVVMKYLYKYLDYETNLPITDVLVKDGEWYLLRQTQLHMRFAEAANREGWHKLAYALFNSGIGQTFDSTGAVDITNWMNTLDYPYPYNFDARYKQTAIPFYRGVWYRNLGVRRRANVMDYQVDATDSLLSVEDGLIQEMALENAFEGARWGDLLRIARRRNDPSFLADKVYQKLLKDGDANAEAARTKLMSKEGWYLPFKL
ncbi:MAG: RagB/SusD family protein [Edaphocola sp.]